MTPYPSLEVRLTDLAWTRFVEFFSASECCLFGWLDGKGMVIAASPALRRRLEPTGAERLDSSLQRYASDRWRAALAELDRTGRPQNLDLVFLNDTSTFRCLVARTGEGELWLFGEPAAETVVPKPLPSQSHDRHLVELERARSIAESLALTDPLTGLANRRQADLWLQAGDAHQDQDEPSLALLMVDIDHLKAVNDTLGHSAGDRVLRAAADSLRQALRACDQIARYGGDEFLNLLHNTDLPGAVAVAERLRRGLARQVVAPLEQGVAASFGTAVRQPGERCESLRDRADAALLSAKSAGRNRVGSD